MNDNQIETNPDLDLALDLLKESLIKLEKSQKERDIINRVVGSLFGAGIASMGIAMVLAIKETID